MTEPPQPVTGTFGERGRSMRVLLGYCMVWLSPVVSIGCTHPTGAQTTAPAHALANQLRVLQPGDNWVWEMEETVRNEGDQTTTSAKGTKSITVVQSEFEGKRTFALSGTMEQFGQSGLWSVYKWEEYISQNEKCDLVTHGDTEGANGALRKLAAPSVLWPGSWSRTTSFTTEARYDDGFTVRLKVNVTGTDELETPIGKLSCWKGETQAIIDCKDTKSVSIDRRTFWFAPQIGALVKEQWTTTEKWPGTNERIREGLFLLRSTDVPLQQKE